MPDPRGSSSSGNSGIAERPAAPPCFVEVRILFYDDRPVFGGQEAMVLRGIESLLEGGGHELRFIACDENSTLLRRLDELAKDFPSLVVERTHESVARFESLRHRFARGRVSDLAVSLRRHEPDLVVAVQGSIECSSLGILAARHERIRTLGYVAMPHSFAARGERFGRLRDLGSRGLIGGPDRWIATCDEMAALLRARGARQPIEVVPPGVDTERFVPHDRDFCREALGMPGDAPLFGCVGRVVFAQKQQHLLVDAMAAPELAGARLLVVGDGPDAGELDARIERLGLRERVRRLAWTDTAAFYPALDALVLPSHHEGLPLVLLEALASGVVALGSDRDGMRDLLPSDRRFDPTSAASIADGLRRFLDGGRPEPRPELTARVRSEMSVGAFKQRFRESLLRLATGA